MPTSVKDQIKIAFSAAKNYLCRRIDVVDNTYSASSDLPLSANQGWKLQNQINGMIDKVYPIGSIYISVINRNPSEFFGGTWVAWGSGRVPIGVNANDTDFNDSEKTGGEKTHTLSVAEMPSHAHTGGGHTHSTPNHTHSISVANGGGSGAFKALQWHTGTSSGIVTQSTNLKDRACSTGTQFGHATFTINTSHGHSLSQSASGGGTSGSGGAVGTTSTGGNGAHNNLPPYITCYMWKRVPSETWVG